MARRHYSCRDCPLGQCLGQHAAAKATDQRVYVSGGASPISECVIHVVSPENGLPVRLALKRVPRSARFAVPEPPRCSVCTVIARFMDARRSRSPATGLGTAVA